MAACVPTRLAAATRGLLAVGSRWLDEAAAEAMLRVHLDSMGCPFDVDLVLYQPCASNSDGQVGSPDPNRQMFLAWLRTVALRITPVTLKHLLGDTIRVSVPCGSLDLTS